jgi:hypothetical protein
MVDINTVYQTVLLILNKEQRGYMTPSEFNKVAQQVQLEIFESYFESLNQQLRSPQNDSEYGDRVKMLRNKIQTFEVTLDLTSPFKLPNNFYRLGTIEFSPNNGNEPIIAEEVNRKIFSNILRSKLTKPTKKNPIYYISDDKIVFSPTGIPTAPEKMTMYYTRKPKIPRWEYSIGAVGQYTYQQSPSRNFELSIQEQTELVLKILSYAGIIIRDPQVIQTAAQMAAGDDMNEKT